MAELICFLAVMAIYYVYGGYLHLLQLLSLLLPAKKQAWPDGPLPTVTVLIAVHNEAAQINERVRNILACSYPRDKLEVLVASDGSTDSTCKIVAACADARVRLHRSDQWRGKSTIQNDAIPLARGDIIILTDAGTRFHPDFLPEIIRPFNDPEVGAADGHLLFQSPNGSTLARAQGHYWRSELRIRELECRLGILAVMSGACLAIRKTAFRPLDPAYGDDCVIPLDVVCQGSRVVHVSSAVATDLSERDPRSVLQARARMTLRNWQGTCSRPELLNPFRRPGYAFALWSHKLLRWLSPIFLLLLSVGTLALAVTRPGPAGWIPVFGLAAFYLAGLIGVVAERAGVSVPGICNVYSFLLANVGFLMGLIRALLGYRITAYGPTK